MFDKHQSLLWSKQGLELVCSATVLEFLPVCILLVHQHL